MCQSSLGNTNDGIEFSGVREGSQEYDRNMTAYTMPLIKVNETTNKDSQIHLYTIN